MKAKRVELIEKIDSVVVAAKADETGWEESFADLLPELKAEVLQHWAAHDRHWGVGMYVGDLMHDIEMFKNGGHPRKLLLRLRRNYRELLKVVGGR